MGTIKNLNDTTPAASSGYQLGKWQQVNTGTTDPATGAAIYDGSVETPGNGGVSKLTTSATAAAGDCGMLLSFTLTGAATYTLPATPPSVPDGGGTNRWRVQLQNQPASSASLTVTATSPAKLDGVTGGSLALTAALGCEVRTDGTDYFTERGNGPGAPGYPGSGSLTVTAAASPSTVNLTTEGTFDWFCPNGSVSPHPWPTATNMKKNSGTAFMMADSFDWVTNGTQTTFTQIFGSPACSCTNTDNVTGVALTSVTTGQGVNSSASGANSYGFRLAVPAGQVSRKLRIYMNVFSGTATCTASLSDGSAATATANVVSAAAANNESFFTITFNAARDGQVLTVTVLLTTNLGSSPDIKFMAATLQ